MDQCCHDQVHCQTLETLETRDSLDLHCVGHSLQEVGLELRGQFDFDFRPQKLEWLPQDLCPDLELQTPLEFPFQYLPDSPYFLPILEHLKKLFKN